MIKRFWHVGMAVRDLDKAVDQYEKLGYTVKHRIEKDEPRAVMARLEHRTGSTIELWQWLEDHYENKFRGNHIAFESDDIDDDVWALVEKGAEVVIPKTTGVITTYAFVRDPSGNYIEIAQGVEE
ncbi:MAG TPA: VOC family protein [Candidatus Saccharimonadales bacterium]|nr:VOC family protein [Candidatus Saccharimonadales bacterium]